jgi:hypothetical protein
MSMTAGDRLGEALTLPQLSRSDLSRLNASAGVARTTISSRSRRALTSRHASASAAAQISAASVTSPT